MSALKIFNPIIFSVLIVIFALLTIFRPPTGTTYFINPSGRDNDNGLSVKTPFQTVQKAVDLAQPGDVINLSPGNYQQDVITKRDGTANAPITITGPKEAIIRGERNARIFEIRHSFIILKGFAIDGQHSNGTDVSDFKDKLIYILGQQSKSGVKGIKITGMTIQNAGGECIRLRYFAQNNELSGNIIRNCGVYYFRFNKEGKNGEGIYIGTAPEQLGDGKNFTNEPDQSSNNWIHNNEIDTQGNECVDIKESSSKNLIENNICTGQKDPDSGGMDSRGPGNVFRNNIIFDNTGAGIRLGGDSINDGINNDIYNNSINNNATGGIKFERNPQRKVCGNSMFGNNDGNSVGTFGKQFEPTVKCL